MHYSYTEPEEGDSVLFHSKIVNISTAVVIEQDDRFLMIKEDEIERQGLWNFPSGKVHVDELLIVAAEREASEETGFPVQVTDLMSVYYYQTSYRNQPRKPNRITVRFNFWGKIEATGSQKVADPAVTEQAWKSREEIKLLGQDKKLRNWITIRMVKEVLAGRKLPLETIHTVRH